MFSVFKSKDDFIGCITRSITLTHWNATRGMCIVRESDLSEALAAEPVINDLSYVNTYQSGLSTISVDIHD